MQDSKDTRNLKNGKQEITAEQPVFRSKPEGPKWNGLSLRELVGLSTANVERDALTEVLRLTGGNKAKAARLLQIDYKTIRSKMKQYGINIDPEQDAKRELRTHHAARQRVLLKMADGLLNE